MQEVKTIYFDESGFTGYNLLDPQQPIFTLASSDIEEEAAEKILVETFPNYKGDEFKFSNIWRQDRHKRRLPVFAAHLAGLGDRAYIWMLDKKFVALTKIVDFLIEPFMTDAGYDFYTDGFCWKYTNYIHFGITQFGEPELLDRILSIYQDFSRNPTVEQLSSLQQQLELMAASVTNEPKIFLEQMALGAKLFREYHNIETFKSSNELHVTSMLASVGHWRQTYEADFEIVHDATASFFRHKELWEKITNNNVPNQMHPLGDGSFVEFPLRVISTTPVDSKDSYVVQFCDVLAGLAARHFGPGTPMENKKLLADVIEAGMGAITYNGIQPAPVFPDQIPPKRLKGPDAVNKMTAIIYGSHNAPK